MLGDVHGQRRLTHGRSRGQHDHLAAAQAADLAVDVEEAGRNGGSHALLRLEHLLNVLHHLFDSIGPLGDFAVLILGDVQEVLLDLA